MLTLNQVQGIQPLAHLDEHLFLIERRPPMITRIAHICILTPDLAATQRFYTEALGFKKAFDFIREGEVVGFYLKMAGGSFIEVFKQDGINAEAKSPLLHFCLEVDDIDKTRQEIISAGYEVKEKSLGGDRSWQIWVTDPAGIKVEFHQYTKDSCQLTGADCIL